MGHFAGKGPGGEMAKLRGCLCSCENRSPALDRKPDIMCGKLGRRVRYLYTQVTRAVVPFRVYQLQV